MLKHTLWRGKCLFTTISGNNKPVLTNKNLFFLGLKDGFQESVVSSKTKKKIKFFNLGKKNDWSALLNKKIIEKVESHFRKEMTDLGYL